MMRASRRILMITALTVGGVALFTGCADDDASPAAGTYVHDEEGTIVVSGDGHATLDQSGVVTSMNWTLSNRTITFAIEGGPSVVATLEGDDLVFEPGAFSGDEPERFERNS